jgi:hypothetical protein
VPKTTTLFLTLLLVRTRTYPPASSQRLARSACGLCFDAAGSGREMGHRVRTAAEAYGGRRGHRGLRDRPMPLWSRCSLPLPSPPPRPKTSSRRGESRRTDRRDPVCPMGYPTSMTRIGCGGVGRGERVPPDGLLTGRPTSPTDDAGAPVTRRDLSIGRTRRARQLRGVRTDSVRLRGVRCRFDRLDNGRVIVLRLVDPGRNRPHAQRLRGAKLRREGSSLE